MKNKLVIFIALLFSMISISCENVYLDTTPTASIDAGSAYATTKNAAAAINGIYRSFVVRYLSSQGHSGHPAMMITLDHLGEDFLIGTTAGTNGWHANESRWVAHRTDVGTFSQFPYEMYYRIIGNANIAGQTNNLSFFGATGSTRITLATNTLSDLLDALAAYGLIVKA